MAQPKLNQSTDYGRFKFLYANRPVDLSTADRRVLRGSMQKHGFLPSFPIMVRPNGGPNSYEVIDGQHRFAAAKELGIPFYYVIDTTDIDISEVNSCSVKWTLKDYVAKWAMDGISDYQELQAFMESYGLAATASAMLLAGKQARPAVKAGKFKIENRQQAHAIARLATEICAAAGMPLKESFVTALSLCFRVPYFDKKRLLTKSRRRPQLISRHGNRDSFLESFESAYNFGSPASQRKPLAFDAIQTVTKAG